MAENDRSIKLFGFEIKRAQSDDPTKKPSIVPARDDDGAGYVTASGTHYGQYLNLDGDDAKDNYQMIMKYRGVAQHPEVDAAIEDIVNESVSGSEMESAVDLNLDGIETSDKIKKIMQEEFDGICAMLNFNELGHDIFRSWYIDGRLVHHLVVNESALSAGIQEIRMIDATKIRKVKEVKYKKDTKTGAKVVDKTEEFYVFQEKSGNTQNAVKLSPDAVSYVTSGLTDPTRKRVVSYLHKAIKPINQLRMMEDSLVIYRLARAPERRIFYIDVGNMPKGKAEEYMQNIMAKYRNKLVYDANTGHIKDDRKHMSMLEDFWLPRKEGGRGTEISTLPGGENLGQIDDIIYFQKRLYRSLNVPINRLEQEAQFSLGRSTEISRDEVKFQKFIDRLRRRFSWVFLGILKKQLMLKQIITEQDWEEWKDDIYVDYVKDNHFTELKEMEIYRERASLLNEMTPFVGDYLSKEWILKNVLRLSDEDIKQMKKEIDGEEKSGEIPDQEERETEKQPAESKPVPVEVVPPKSEIESQKEKEAEKPKQERYIPTHEDELTEELTRYMARLNEQN